MEGWGEEGKGDVQPLMSIETKSKNETEEVMWSATRQVRARFRGTEGEGREKRIRKERDVHLSMYFSVGKSSGSHPTFFDPEGWYTLTCSTYWTTHARRVEEDRDQRRLSLPNQTRGSLD